MHGWRLLAFFSSSAASVLASAISFCTALIFAARSAWDVSAMKKCYGLDVYINTYITLLLCWHINHMYICMYVYIYIHIIYIYLSLDWWCTLGHTCYRIRNFAWGQQLRGFRWPWSSSHSLPALSDPHVGMAITWRTWWVVSFKHVSFRCVLWFAGILTGWWWWWWCFGAHWAHGIWNRGLGFQAACGSRVQLLLDLLKPMNEEHINPNNIINIQHSTATSRKLGV